MFNNLKIEFYKKQIDKFNFISKQKNVLISYFIYSEVNQNNYKVLEIFCRLHLSLNSDLEIIIFTNSKDLQNKINFIDARLYFFQIQTFDFQFMDTKTIINYLIFDKFKKQNYLFIFDFDFIPLRPFTQKLLINSIGLTFEHEWMLIPKFPINAGFLLINCSNNKMLSVFKENYLSSYKEVINNQSKFIKKYPLVDEKSDLSTWWGDQFGLLKLLEGLELPNFESAYSIDFKGVNYTLFSERIFNFQPLKLKKLEKNNEKVTKYLEKIFHDTFFLHLTGNRKIHIDQIYIFLKNKYKL